MAITPEQARIELAKRELARRQSQTQISQTNQETPSEPIGAEPRLANRKSMMADLIQDPSTLERLKKHPLGTILRTLGGAAEVYQGVPASISLDLQKGRLQDIPQNIGKVLTGKRPAEYGDVYKEAGAPELLAKGMGLFTDIMFSPGGAESTVKIGNTIKNLTGKSVGKSVKILKGFLRYDNSLKQAAKAKEGLNTLRTTLGSAKEVAIQQVKDVPVAFDFGKNKVGTKLINHIKNPMYEIQFAPDGKIVQTIGNMDKVKMAVDDMIHSPKVWEEATTMEQRYIKLFRQDIRNAMVKSSKTVGKNIQPALDAYSKFMDSYHLVNKTLVDTAGNLMANKLKSAFKLTAEPAIKQAWKDVAKGNPAVKQVMNTMNRRELLKNLLKVTGATGVVTGAAVKVFEK